jgi:hypothetical protein
MTPVVDASNARMALKRRSRGPAGPWTLGLVEADLS